jgi:hypothetical protein
MLVRHRWRQSRRLEGRYRRPTRGTLKTGGIAVALYGCMATKRSGGKRDTVRTRTATSYAKRTARGRFKEMDEKGRSLKADRRGKAKRKVRSGYGDRGDRAA